MTPAEFLAAFSAACDIHRAAGETGDMGRACRAQRQLRHLTARLSEEPALAEACLPAMLALEDPWARGWGAAFCLALALEDPWARGWGAAFCLALGRELPAAIAVLERDAADPTLGPCARDAAALLRSWREGSIPPAD